MPKSIEGRRVAREWPKNVRIRKNFPANKGAGGTANEIHKVE